MKNVNKLSTAIIAGLMLLGSQVSFGQDENVLTENPLAPPPPPRVLSQSETIEGVNSLSFFPNPCRENLTVILSDKVGLQNEEVSIYNLTGKKVWNGFIGQKGIVDVSKLNTGIYIISCNGVSYKFQKV
ncbi:hypothetical protein Oweho_1291 [Owenweeksia hongkongensis DSM 17368]|uniref:Secretion system C-terminal sorting domain-containing protein n=1 Tax=Owenweeksia hongkongensis (strain DSM 17368 / CIP 108786 / JCM 12287 / NRRL B-23963 / UST20020801) TaxID=926562 RepID=G8R6V6_OWEHD|nr:T9SS type A sorting domain-containing protein [Owenweeksia hongkongensis]AEV32291.1 hypothetical protein Oweho_1291 [Owenweeksia hongkongensis DSM 17368]